MRLTTFESWLIQHGRSPATARRYEIFARSVFRTEEVARGLLQSPEEGGTAILLHEAALTSAQRSPFRAAIRALDVFLTERGHSSICPKFPDARMTPPSPPQEHSLSPLLARLARESMIPWSVVEGLKWKHVRGTPASAFWFVDDPGDHRGYRAPSDLLIQLNLWAGGGQKPPLNTPLVPREPLSLFPMPAAMLRSLARG